MNLGVGSSRSCRSLTIMVCIVPLNHVMIIMGGIVQSTLVEIRVGGE